MFHFLENYYNYQLFFKLDYSPLSFNDSKNFVPRNNFGTIASSFDISDNIDSVQKYLIYKNGDNLAVKTNFNYLKYLKLTDKLLNWISFGGTVVGVVRFLKPFEFDNFDKILGWTFCITSFYGILNYGYYFYHRKIFQQKSINVFNNYHESLFWGLSFGVTICGTYSTFGYAYLQYAASVGENVGQKICFTINASIFASFFINGIFLFFNSVNIVKNYTKTKAIKAAKIFQLTVSAIFFIHSFLQLKTANSIIKDAQKSKLSQIRTELDENYYQKINFDRKIILDQTKAITFRKSKTDGTAATIKQLNALLKLPNWKENFGKPVHPESSAAIHASQPTHLSNNNEDIILRENAILKAQYSHKTRYDGNRINQKSTNTVLAIPPHQLDIKLAEEALRKNIPKGPVSLPGKYYGYEIKLGPKGIFKSDKIIIAENPQFYFNGERATHYFSNGGTLQYLEKLPENVKEIFVDLNHRNFKGYYFINFYNFKNDTTLLNDKNEIDNSEVY